MTLNVGKISAWYIKHKEHVDNLVRNADRSYPPSERGDVNHPELWKAEHWKWFLNSPVIPKPMNEEKTKQKSLLIEIMKEDEKNGMYEDPKRNPEYVHDWDDQMTIAASIEPESTPSGEQESQEDHIPDSGKMIEEEQDALWWKVFYVLEFSNVDPNNGIEELKKQFIITRKSDKQ